MISRTARFRFRRGALGRSARRRCAKCRYIRNVLRPSRCGLRGHEVTAGNKTRLEAARRIDDALNALFPCAVKINAVDLRQDIHGNRLPAHAEKLAALCEIFARESFHWRAEFRQSRIDCLGVVGVGLNHLRVPICEGFRFMPPSWFLQFWTDQALSLIHISEPTRQAEISYAVFCL